MKTNFTQSLCAPLLKGHTSPFSVLKQHFRISALQKAVRTGVFITLLLTAFVNANSQISGVVFRDFNGNGIKDNTVSFNEPFAEGVTVKATLPSGTHHTAVTNSSGAYSFSVMQIPAATKVRIEFSGLETGDFSSSNGSGNGTNVQFTTAPDVAINYAINAPEDYWNNTAASNPPLMAVNSRRGTTNSFHSGQYTLLQIDNNTSGPANPADQNVVTADTSKKIMHHYQTGSVFGLAVQNKQERFFVSAILKRASGFGPRGAGGIYIAGKSGATWNMAGSFTLQGVMPSNGGPSLDFGTVTRVTSPVTDDNFISDNQKWASGAGSDTRDMDAFAKAGTMSYGDIEADPNSDKIYMVNLYQNRLIVFNASATTALLNGASAATLAAYTTAYDITSLPGCPVPSGPGNNIRPFAVKIYKGRGYIGVVSDAMASQTRSHLMGYVLQFDPQNIAAGFTTVVNITFNNYRDNGGGRYWRPWVNSWAQTGGTISTGPVQWAQPMISGIEFNEDGSMDIGIRDRWGDQGAVFEYIPVSGSTDHLQTAVLGDLLHACKTATGWAVEGSPGSCDQPVANTNANTPTNNFGYGFSYGNNGREWYADRSGDGDPESGEGGLTKLMGTGVIVSTVYDPIEGGETIGSNYWSTQGIQWNTVATGAKHHIARIQGENANSMDKANGMGDLEFITQMQPIQIGNRIWFDADADGIQDADEDMAGVPAGTVVTLQSPGVDGIFNNADDQTWTTVTDAKGNYFFRTLSSADNRKPASWTGVGNIILPGYNYRIKVATPSGYSLTWVDAGADLIDSDAYLSSGAVATVDFNTANTNHNFDIGFFNLTILPADHLELAAAKKENEVTLNWKTTNENNTSHFITERSTDGVHFSVIGKTVTAAGSTVSEMKYMATDDIAIIAEKSTLYYRVKLYDKNNNFRYSNIAVIKTDGIDVKVWPNPFAEYINVTAEVKTAAKITVNITDVSGRLMKTQQQQIPPGRSIIKVGDLNRMPAGTYVVTVINNGDAGRKTYKIMK